MKISKSYIGLIMLNSILIGLLAAQCIVFGITSFTVIAAIFSIIGIIFALTSQPDY